MKQAIDFILFNHIIIDGLLFVKSFRKYDITRNTKCSFQMRLRLFMPSLLKGALIFFTELRLAQVDCSIQFYSSTL